MRKRKQKLEAEAAEVVNFCRSGSTLVKEFGSRSELESKSVEKELEAKAIFSKSGASEFSNWLQPTIGDKCNNNDTGCL